MKKSNRSSLDHEYGEEMFQTEVLQYFFYEKNKARKGRGNGKLITRTCTVTGGIFSGVVALR